MHCYLWLLLAAAAPETSSEVLPDGQSVRLQIEGTIDAPFERVDAIVGEPALYPGWIPIFKKAVPLSPPRWDTEWHLPWPLGTIRQRMRFERRAIDNGALYLFEQERGDMKRHVGLWALTRVDDTHTQVLYQAEVAFQSWLPRSLIAAFQRGELPKLFKRLNEEVARRRWVGIPDPTPGRPAHEAQKFQPEAKNPGI